jgi:hypothetical protein
VVSRRARGRLSAALAGFALLLAPAAPAAQDRGLLRGIQEVEAGEDLVATDTLQKAVRRLYRKPESRAELARAYLYLGIAWARMERPGRATANFAEALAIDWQLEPDEALRDEAVDGAFEAARRETREAGRAPAGAAKKAGIGALGIAAIAGGAVGVAALVAAGGEDPPAEFEIEVVVLAKYGDAPCAPPDGQILAAVEKLPQLTEYPRGSQVTLRPRWNVDNFYSWGGACAPYGFEPVCRLQMETDVLVTACWIG